MSVMTIWGKGSLVGVSLEPGGRLSSPSLEPSEEGTLHTQFTNSREDKKPTVPAGRQRADQQGVECS